MNLNNSVVYDIETYPNCFTLAMECLNSDLKAVWEISHKRDDRYQLMEWFTWLSRTETPMIGFNSLHFDYPVIHALFSDPRMSVEQIYAKAMSIIQSNDKFANTVWASNRFAPQIDLFTIYHFDNPAKSTSLKWLQVNMKSESVVDLPFPVGCNLDAEQIDHYLKPYNFHDVAKTKAFAQQSKSAFDFRVNLIPQFGVDVVNWNDTKIGEQMVISKIGDELCYDRSTGRRKTRQTPRAYINLNDIIFPYINFEHPEFSRVLDYMRQQVLKPDEFADSEVIKTKGVFTNLSAHVGGLDFGFGVGGIHASLEKKRFVANENWLIKDIDVAALYPSIAIQNRLAPAHLGEAFINVYSELPKERKKWQQDKGKKCVEANALKLASNGVYGKSNSMFSPFYDPQFTMTITINGQLMLCMLAEQLIKIPTLQLIQANTDGITYAVHKDYLPTTVEIENWWQNLTKLVLEEGFFNRIWIRDVNNYLAEGIDGSLKQKGAYWFPDPLNHFESISSQQPPAWHKNFSNMASVKAAVAQMVHGIDPEVFLRMHHDPYDFMNAVKVRGKAKLYHGSKEVQKTTRFYVVKNGDVLMKISDPTGTIGSYKRKNGVTEHEYNRVMSETGGRWDERVCTKNKSMYELTKTNMCAGFQTSISNNVGDFEWGNLNYDWYVAEACKLII